MPRAKKNIKSILTSTQRKDFERQLFALCLVSTDFRRIVEKAYLDFCFIAEETNLQSAEVGKKYCEIILKNNKLLYDFSGIPKKLGEASSTYYIYRNDVIEKIYSMTVKAKLIS